MKRAAVRFPMKAALSVIVPILAVLGAFGCKSVVTQANATELARAKASNSAKLKWPQMVTIPAGTPLMVSLNTTVRTDREMSGDGFNARLYSPVQVDQMTVLPAGTVVRGRLILVAEPYTTSGKAKVSLVFDRIVDPSGKVLSISTMPIFFVGQGNKVNGKDKLAPVTVLKPGVGATSDGVIVFATESQQIELPSNQRFEVRLDEPLRVSVARLTANK